MIQGGCPICGGTVDRTARSEGVAPFCSARCRTIDLGQWLGDRYRLPAPPDESDGEPMQPADEA